MPRDGSMIFGDLIDQLDQLAITCPKCDRLGRYSLKRLILARGRERQGH